MTKTISFVSLSIAGLLFYLSSCQNETADRISYNTHIRPIFSDKCFKCHGPDAAQRKADYRLDTKEGALAALKSDPKRRAIVPGKPDQSDVINRIHSTDPDIMMPTPESGLVLSENEKQLINQWIKEGAEFEQHWAFIPIKKPTLPKVENQDWAKNEIDHFILQKLATLDIDPQSTEDPERLLRRLYHDVTGLPPTIADQDQFIADPTDAAYEKVVDKLLTSPSYGERMAVIWMDIARYADSHGYQDDGLRTMWPWRDWVIHAFNKNYSYQKFITYQLAGDLMPDANKETILATGFNRNHKITQEGGVIDEEYRVEYVSDRTNTFSKGMLAMTFECAKCHDHKYDPIAQNDYFGAFAFFNQVNEKGLVGDISLASLADPPYMTITDQDKADILAFVNKQDTMDVKVMIMKDSSLLRPTHILNRGQYDQPGTLVTHHMPPSIMSYDTLKYAKNRMGLTQWMFDNKNPLTSRVFVNHVWQAFFGRGIVKTTGDFGLQGELPTHPALLDWLAADFMEHGWDIKRLVKQIAMSATYRQSSQVSKESYALDPDNKYLSRGPRVRLDGEFVKDHVLASSGLLFNDVGGPSVKTYQPEGLWEGASSGRGQLAIFVQDTGKLLYKRGLYQFIKRTVPPPNMLIFDASNRDQCEVKRNATNTPLQALVMMNDILVGEGSRVMAARLASQKLSLEKSITQAWRAILCRMPKTSELASLSKFYQSTLKGMTSDKASKLLQVGMSPQPKTDQVNTASLMQTIQLIYNLEESSIR
jgi:hypothetical protein